MKELYELSIKQAADMLEKKEISAQELTQACIARAKQSEQKINALVTLCEEEALAMAKAVDEKRARG